MGDGGWWWRAGLIRRLVTLAFFSFLIIDLHPTVGNYNIPTSPTRSMSEKFNAVKKKDDGTI